MIFDMSITLIRVDTVKSKPTNDALTIVRGPIFINVLKHLTNRIDRSLIDMQYLQGRKHYFTQRGGVSMA